jgi:clan AA aspartic protease (TIGR02281 family)
MTRLRHSLILVLASSIITILQSAAAAAEFYRWTDASGNVGFSDRLQSVPTAYRDQIEVRASSASRTVGFQLYSGSATDAVSNSTLSAGASTADVIPFEREGELMKVMVWLNDEIVVPFFVDTASSGVTLPSQVAERLGVLNDGPPQELEAVLTANGLAHLGVVALDSVQLGQSRVNGLKGLVNPHLETGLLGGEFFNHFAYSVDPASGTLTLRVAER